MGAFLLRHRVTVVLALVFVVASTAAVFSVMAYAASRQTAAASLSNVKISKFDATDNYISLSTPSCGDGSVRDYFDVPGMTKTFKLGGTASRPVTVTYSGDMITQGTTGELRFLVDGTQEGTGLYDVRGDDPSTPSTQPTGFTALTPPLSPGNHTVEIQYSGERGYCFDGPQTLVILHS
jgi:hypothetical protein